MGLRAWPNGWGDLGAALLLTIACEKADGRMEEAKMEGGTLWLGTGGTASGTGWAGACDRLVAGAGSGSSSVSDVRSMTPFSSTGYARWNAENDKTTSCGSVLTMTWVSATLPCGGA